MVNPEAIARGGEAVRRLAELEGVEIFSVHPTLVPLPGWRERRSGLAPTIRLALEAGAGLVVMHTPRSATLSEGEGLAFQQRIETWQPRLANTKLHLAVENIAIRSMGDEGYILTPLERLRAYADRHDLVLVLDTTHSGTAGEDLLQARQIFDGRLANVHLSDTGGWVPLSRSRRVEMLLGQHRFPGKGDLDLSGLLASLERESYAGPITLELNPQEVAAWWPPAIRRHMARAANWTRQAAGR